MLRIPAIRSLLVNTVADVRGGAESAEVDTAALRAARRRAGAVALLDWVAILILVLWRSGGSSFLPTGASPEGLFSLGILAVATHAGFRLGQREKYNAVLRTLEELPEEGP
jgi:hypothetical protein